MNALICTKPFQLEYTQIDDPVVTPGNTLLRIRRIGVCGTDLHAYEGTQPYFSYPRILGHELAAEIIQTDAAGFSIGERVSFIPYFHCGNCIACRAGKTNCCVQMQVCGVHKDGGMCEYLTVPSSHLIHGNGLEWDELALIEPLAIGAHAVNRAGLMPGEWVLVTGAGPIGLATIAFAKIAGARVIVMDTSEPRLAFCKKHLSVEHALHPGKAEMLEAVKEITSNQMPTAVFDATGNLKAINNAFQFIAHGGRYVLIGLQKEEIVFSHPEFHKREATLMSSRNAILPDFEQVMQAVQQKLITPADFITHRAFLPQVAERFPQWLHPGSGIVKAIIDC